MSAVDRRGFLALLGLGLIVVGGYLVVVGVCLVFCGFSPAVFAVLMGIAVTAAGVWLAAKGMRGSTEAPVAAKTAKEVYAEMEASTPGQVCVCVCGWVAFALA